MNRAFDNQKAQDFVPNEIYSFDPETDGFIRGPSLIVSRYPLPHTRQIGSEVNVERLPALSERADMQLAFREEPLTESAIRRFSDKWLLTLFVFTSVVAIIFGLGLPFIKPLLMPYGLALSAFLGVLIAGPFFAAKKMTFPLFVACLFLPPIAALTLYFLSLGLEYRIVSSTILAMAMLYVLWNVGKEVFTFYNNWLLCEPRLKPETRAKELGKTLGSPNLIVAFVVAVISVALTWFSPLAAILVVLIITIGTILVYGAVPNAPSFLDVLNQSRHLLGHYLTYGRISSGAAGVWLPKHSARFRVTLVLLLCGIVSLFFSISLQGFFPWDTPEIFKNDFVNETTKYDDMRRSHAWVLMSVQMISEGKLHLLWAFPISFGLSFVIPTSFLVAVFYGPISASFIRRKEIESQFDNDRRTEWQWYVDRIRKIRP